MRKLPMARRVRIGSLTILALVSTLIIPIVTAAPASAAVSGLQEVSVVSGASPANKTLTVSCPGGKRLLGPGAQITGGSGHVQIAGINIDASLTSASATAVVVGSFGGNWSLRATALCADPLPGLQRVVSNVNAFGGQAKATAQCPGGTVGIGQGFTVLGVPTGGLGQLRIPRLDTSTLPTGGTGARVEAFETNVFPSAWTLSGQAICATLTPAPVRVVEFREASTPNSILAGCPSGGGAQGMLSGGFITDPNANTIMTTVGVRFSVQSGSLKLTAAAARAESVLSGPTINAFSIAICA